MPTASDRAGEEAHDGPLVSVVLCTYNGGRFLAEQLDSLLAQTWPHLEVVAVDDASTDDSVAILRRYADRDPRIRIVVNTQNLGFARNFAQALPLGRGPLIAPCDQDDIWHPDKLAALVATVAGHSAAYCDSELVDEKGAALKQRMSQIVPMRTLSDPLPFAFGNCVSGHALLFERALLERALPIPEAFFHDWWLATVAATAKGIVFCERVLVEYRQHGRNVTDERLATMRIEAGLGTVANSGDTQVVRRSVSGVRRVPGHRLRYLRETEERLAAIARLPGRHQAFAAELLRLWRSRETQWVSFSLWRTMSRHRDRLLELTGMSPRKRKLYCRELLAGVRAKRLTHRSAYTLT